jgi:hypothetical protein
MYGPKETTKYPSQGNRRPFRHSNPRPTAWEGGVIPTRPSRYAWVVTRIRLILLLINRLHLPNLQMNWRQEALFTELLIGHVKGGTGLKRVVLKRFGNCGTLWTSSIKGKVDSSYRRWNFEFQYQRWASSWFSVTCLISKLFGYMINLFSG